MTSGVTSTSGASATAAAHRQDWADVVDSPPEQLSQNSRHEPSQLFPNTPESTQEVPSPPVSQESVRAAPEVFPSTPDSFDGSQPHTGLTQDFRTTMTIQPTTAQPSLHHLQEPSPS